MHIKKILTRAQICPLYYLYYKQTRYRYSQLDVKCINALVCHTINQQYHVYRLQDAN